MATKFIIYRIPCIIKILDTGNVKTEFTSETWCCIAEMHKQSDHMLMLLVYG